jgi:hypothetical protein
MPFKLEDRFLHRKKKKCKFPLTEKLLVLSYANMHPFFFY